MKKKKSTKSRFNRAAAELLPELLAELAPAKKKVTTKKVTKDKARPVPKAGSKRATQAKSKTKKRGHMDRNDRDRGRDKDRGRDDDRHPASGTSPVLLVRHHRSKEEAEAPPATGAPPNPPGIPNGVPTAPATHAYTQIPQRIDLKLKGVKREGEHIDNQGLKNLLDGSDPLNAGDVVNFDCSPFDQNNQEIGPFGDQPYTDLDQFLLDPRLGTYTSADADAVTTTGARWPEGKTNHRTQYHLSRGGSANVNITGEYRDYGLPFNVKVEHDSGEGDFSIQEVAYLPDGRTLTSNVISLRVKPWQT